jgi:transposase
VRAMPVSPGRCRRRWMKRRCMPRCIGGWCRCRAPRPDFGFRHAELRRRGVTRLLLWEEYKSAHPDG